MQDVELEEQVGGFGTSVPDPALLELEAPEREQVALEPIDQKQVSQSNTCRSKNERRLEKIILWIVSNALTDSPENQSNSTLDLLNDVARPLEDSKEKDQAVGGQKQERAKSFIRLIQDLKNNNEYVRAKRLRRSRQKRQDSDEDSDIFRKLKKIKLNSSLLSSFQQEIEPKLCLTNEETRMSEQVGTHQQISQPPMISHP